MADQLLGLRVFVRVARATSFSRAARELRLSQPSISRIVTQLEAELGVTLFSRSTRSVALTEVGQTYLTSIQNVLDLLDEANEGLRETGDFGGTLRIGASSIFASRVIVPRLGRFLAGHPRLRVDLAVDDGRQSLVTEGVDVAIRFGPLHEKEASTIARRLGSWPISLAAAPEYIARFGSPREPEELATHTAVLAGPARDGRWTLRDGTREVAVHMRGTVSVNASEVGINAGLAGLGIIATTPLTIAHYVEDGRLVRVLPGWTLGELACHAVYPGGQSVKAAARAFTDFLIDALKRMPALAADAVRPARGPRRRTARSP